MPKSEKQKQKILYLEKFLKEMSDEEHRLSTQRLIELLEENDISAERKSIYKDIDALNEFGYEVSNDKSKVNGGYYYIPDSKTDFELAEIKILVDMVQSSKFLSEKKSKKLISKLEKLTNIYQARELRYAIRVVGRAKSENENVFYSVDSIHNAINANKSITFSYQQYTLDKSIKLRHQGKKYNVSPYFLVWNNENYYLIGVDNSIGERRNYRVDRMQDIQMSKEDRMYHELYEDFDITAYSKSSFNMFDGDKQKITMKFDNRLLNVVIDQYGKDLSLHKHDDSSFTFSVDVCLSQQFYGWLMGLGMGAEILSPESARTEFAKYIKSIYEKYT